MLIVALVLFVSAFLPGVNMIAAFFAFVVLAMDSSDYAFEARTMNFAQRLTYVRSNWPEYFGMASFLALTALIPGLILLVMPFAVIGSAALMQGDPKMTKVVR